MTRRVFATLVALILVISPTGVRAGAEVGQVPEPPASQTHPAESGSATAPNAEVAAVLATAIKVVAGSYHASRADRRGAASSAGVENDRGQLGDNSTINRSAPVDVVGLASGV